MKNDDARLKRSLEFSLPDALLLYRTLMLGGNVAMMSGQAVAEGRLRALARQIENLIPGEAKLFKPEDWCEIGAALETAESFRVSIENDDRRRQDWWFEGMLTVTVTPKDGGAPKAFHTSNWDCRKLKKDATGVITEVYGVLAELAPIGVEGKLGRDGEEIELDAPLKL